MLLIWLLMPAFAAADMYLHGMRGSNNRLDEQNRDRNNANRLFDSQNNNRGGVNVGSVYVLEGSTAHFDWANQHGCHNPHLHCNIVVQLNCDPRNRDGTTTQTIPVNQNQCTNEDCDTDVEYGRQESYNSYQNCLWHERNKGLFTANQNLRGESAIYTRQNPNGQRSGYECPEERDYYPYWRPTEWIDVAIFTDDESRCREYQQESQNQAPRFYCKVTPEYIWWNSAKNRQAFIPITADQCASLKMPAVYPDTRAIVTQPTNPNEYVPVTDPALQQYGEWTQLPARELPPPLCHVTEYTRDNHLGHVQGGHYWFFNWSVPAALSYLRMEPPVDTCVMRFRCNISTMDFPDFRNASSVQAPEGVDHTANSKLSNPEPGRDPANISHIWTAHGLTYEDNKMCFRAENSNNGAVAGRERCREYVLQDNPKVDIFGSLLPAASQGKVKLQLAINTAQFGRTFQDRTHSFGIHALAPQDACTGKVIENVQVTGKRGNIVQTYPSHEYDFSPEWLDIQTGNCVHFQWTGSDTNPNNNAGQGRQGSDRSNVVLLRAANYEEGQTANFRQTNMPQYGQLGNSYPAFISRTYRDSNQPNPLARGNAGAGAANFLGLSYHDLDYLARQKYGGEVSELDDAPVYVDLGPRVVTGGVGTYRYLSTRNNNFSNRSQKGVITITLTTSAQYMFGVSGGAMQIGHNNWLHVPNGAFSQLARITITATPKDQAKHTFKKKPASNFLQVSPSNLPLNQGYSAALSIAYESRALRYPVVYRSDSMTGEWTKMETEKVESDMARVQITQGGVYVVATPVRGWKAFLLFLVVFSLLLLCCCAVYRKRSEVPGTSFMPNGRRTTAKHHAAASVRPQATAAPVVTPSPDQESSSGLPAGWEQQIDEQTGKTYYVNNKTAESQWEAPTHPA